MVNQSVGSTACKARCVGLTSSSNSLTRGLNGQPLSPSLAPVDALLPCRRAFGKVFRQPFNRGKWVRISWATPAARCPSATSFSLRSFHLVEAGASADTGDTRRMTHACQQDRRQGEEDNQGIALSPLWVATRSLASTAMKIACCLLPVAQLCRYSAAYCAYHAAGQ